MSAAYRPKVYCASKLRHAALWRKLRDEEWPEIEITSRWIDHADKEESARAIDWAHYWTMDIQDVQRSDFVLLFATLADVDELHGALVECGAALALGKRVINVGQCAKSWTNHPLVYSCPSLEYAHDFLSLFTTIPPRRKGLPI